METIKLTASCVCASYDTQKNEYVVNNGGIAGMTAAASLQRDPEPLKGGTDEVELDGNRVNR